MYIVHIHDIVHVQYMYIHNVKYMYMYMYRNETDLFYTFPCDGNAMLFVQLIIQHPVSYYIENTQQTTTLMKCTCTNLVLPFAYVYMYTVLCCIKFYS